MPDRRACRRPETGRADPCAAGWRVLVARAAAGAGRDLGVPGFVTQDGPAHLYNAQHPRAVVRPGLAVPAVLRGALGAAAELGGAPGAGRAWSRSCRRGGRPRDDDADAGRVRGRRSSGSAGGSRGWRGLPAAAAAGGPAGAERRPGCSGSPASCSGPASSRSRSASGGRAATGSGRRRAVALAALAGPGLLLPPGQPGADGRRPGGPGRARRPAATGLARRAAWTAAAPGPAGPARPDLPAA